jgi:NADH:ubiquinone oxidoreductase subunit 5 (subunit L)/multisubunit Na+/H+ antiporter MnhA subunit
MALAITGVGGLALLGGILLLGEITGSYELTTILASGPQIRAHPLYLPTLILVLLGVFLLARLFPALSGTWEWSHLDGGIGTPLAAVAGVPHHQSRDLQGLAVHGRLHHRPRNRHARPAPHQRPVEIHALHRDAGHGGGARVRGSAPACSRLWKCATLA